MISTVRREKGRVKWGKERERGHGGEESERKMVKRRKRKMMREARD